MKTPPKFAPVVALQKLRKYCSYQERCHREVKHKLIEWSIFNPDQDRIVAQLIEEGFLNEERFAKALAGGKFRQKGWGRKKIVNALKQNGISSYLVNSALGEIEEDDYEKKLAALLEKKNLTMKPENTLVMKQKLVRYGISKGYEPELVWRLVNDLVK